MSQVIEELAVIGALIGLLLIAMGMAQITQPTVIARLMTTPMKPLASLGAANIAIGAALLIASVIAYARARELGVEL